MQPLVFVYGTLRKGFRNAHLLEEQTLICDQAHTLEHGELLVFYDRPFISFAKQRYPLKGELYQVDPQGLELLDELEKHPHWYRRIEKTFYSPTLDKEMTAFCYELFDAPELEFCTLHHNGCYKDYMQNYNGESAMDYIIQDKRVLKKK